MSVRSFEPTSEGERLCGAGRRERAGPVTYELSGASVLTRVRREDPRDEATVRGGVD